VIDEDKSIKLLKHKGSNSKIYLFIQNEEKK